MKPNLLNNLEYIFVDSEGDELECCSLLKLDNEVSDRMWFEAISDNGEKYRIAIQFEEI